MPTEGSSSLDVARALERRGRAIVVDVRAEGPFHAGHLPGSGNLPLAELKPRRSELPPRDAEVLVVADQGAVALEGATVLEALGYARVAWLDESLAALPSGLEERGSGVRLWRPAPFLEEVLPRLGRGRALDLAAGAGREAVFLAMHGFDVEAWDHDRDVLIRAASLAQRHGVSITTAVHNLERRQPELPVDRFQVVTVFRFLHRPLFPPIERAVAPEGWLVYETYRQGQERYGRPTHPRFLLREGELRGAFPRLIVEHYQELAPEGGPITARLLARRPG